MLHQILSKLEHIFSINPVLGLVVSFLAGVVASFSPCIYPLIPITLGVIGSVKSSTHSKGKGFILSCVFVLGISVAYSVLGIVSASLGVFFHTFFIHPITYLLLSLVFLVLGLLAMGVALFRLPWFSVNYLPKKRGLISVFVLGVISGLAVVPCNFPVLGSILSIISLKANLVYGAVALFCFSLGYGLILLILGSFTSLIDKLPKQGPWLLRIRMVFGVALIFMSGYFGLKFIAIVR
ncbi:MAG: cytochrome c biogenesis protein CcdA [Candidatus Omnitrophica bacterium]|nr:cytochrome c biogenesis protein CcdA [Candidatus Omnitrophota bacterium]